MVCGIGEDILEVCAHFAVYGLPESCEGVECWLREDGEVIFERWEAGEPVSVSEGLQVEDELADCHCWSLLGLRDFRGDDSEGKVGEGEMAVLRDGEPGSEGCHGEGSAYDSEVWIFGVKLEGRARERSQHVECVLMKCMESLKLSTATGTVKQGSKERRGDAGLKRRNSAPTPVFHIGSMVTSSSIDRLCLILRKLSRSTEVRNGNARCSGEVVMSQRMLQSGES